MVCKHTPPPTPQGTVLWNLAAHSSLRRARRFSGGAVRDASSFLLHLKAFYCIEFFSVRLGLRVCTTALPNVFECGRNGPSFSFTAPAAHVEWSSTSIAGLAASWPASLRNVGLPFHAAPPTKHQPTVQLHRSLPALSWWRRRRPRGRTCDCNSSLRHWYCRAHTRHPSFFHTSPLQPLRLTSQTPTHPTHDSSTTCMHLLLSAPDRGAPPSPGDHRPASTVVAHIAVHCTAPVPA